MGPGDRAGTDAQPAPDFRVVFALAATQASPAQPQPLVLVPALMPADLQSALALHQQQRTLLAHPLAGLLQHQVLLTLQALVNQHLHSHAAQAQARGAAVPLQAGDRRFATLPPRPPTPPTPPPPTPPPPQQQLPPPPPQQPQHGKRDREYWRRWRQRFRELESPKEREERLAKDRERHRLRKAAETPEERRRRLNSRRDYLHAKLLRAPRPDPNRILGVLQAVMPDALLAAASPQGLAGIPAADRSAEAVALAAAAAAAAVASPQATRSAGRGTARPGVSDG
ncbi:hypothetical protein HK105_201335 [Polyrhizophydium stewartii]|uniref:Uncharacterized protein n=1 Tax=Polyrhizophydium stewartii TaxID=2732419 RepID=A0ABR4NHX4_9FUNG|nr:hypothetical protein HK105_007948 [Polyrhizophydium stewartii]